MNTPKAILFDLDAVLTDTSEYHYQAWKHLVDDEGIPFTRQENAAHLRGVGRALPHQESDFAFFNKHRLWDHRCVFNSPAASSIPTRRKDRKPL